MELNDFVHKMNKELEKFQVIHHQWNRENPKLFPLDLPDEMEPGLDWFNLYIDHWVSAADEKVIDDLIKKTR